MKREINYQRFSDQSATNCNRKVHYFFVQGYCFAIFLRNKSLYIFDSHSRDSVGLQTTSGTSVLLSFLSHDHLSAYIHQCYIWNVGDRSDSNRELQYEIQFVKVSTTQQFVSESLKYNIIRNKSLQFRIFFRKVKCQIMWNPLVCLQKQV